MATDKPSHAEDDYFAREDVEKRYRLAKQRTEQLATHEQAALKALHWMKCPNCGHELQNVPFQGATIAKCFHCGGTFLDQKAMEHLAGKSPAGHGGVLQTIVDFFKRP